MSQTCHGEAMLSLLYKKKRNGAFAGCMYGLEKHDTDLTALICLAVSPVGNCGISVRREEPVVPFPHLSLLTAVESPPLCSDASSSSITHSSNRMTTLYRHTHLSEFPNDEKKPMWAQSRARALA